MNRLEASLFSGAESPEYLDTRFGRIALQTHNALTFSRGLLGMPDKFRFFLTDFPSAHLARFKLLQSLDDYSLSFITSPLALQNPIILSEDLTAAARELAIDPEHMAVLLIVSVHRGPSRITLSVNARAPLLIDANTRQAAQYVFQSDKYKVQHLITA